ncbi:serine protein kinase RIO [Candidatus Woesearchaeota archaeon]|nr:serine protein kinase RIO [Candidatus Woesearchaeota archaeon]
MAKISKEKWKIYGNVFDAYTLRLLFKLSSQGHFEELASPIALGKEANIFTAKTKNDELVIIKIYRLENCNFNKMYDYIKSDPRYMNLKKQRRKIVFAWTQREYRNLLQARQVISVPKPITITDHVLVLEMIGKKTPAPQLKDKLPKNKEEFAEKIIINMKKLYEANLVHGDLSEFNILNFEEEPVFIDFSQSTTKKDPNFDEYLDRDIKNIVRYLNKTGIKISIEELTKKVVS